MLIRDAEVWRHGRADVRLAGGLIAQIGDLPPMDGERVLDARGGTLLPGLHDHHIHLAGLAARAASVPCGPPQVTTREELAAALRECPGRGWLRGIGYHESVMGLPGAAELDRLVPDRPLRIQHRSGRMWLLNSPALALLLDRAEPPPGLERGGTAFTGRLFDEDRWLQAALGSAPPDLSAVSARLAGLGVTGVTDMSPRNDPAMAAHVAAQMAGGALRQRCVLAGSLALADAAPGPWQLGPVKLHLHEAAFPPFAEAVDLIAAAHRQGRAVAVHCVSEVELVFALAALEEAGAAAGDRIEHASVASPELVARIAAAGLAVCVQPHFVAERGDRYLLDVEPRHHGDHNRLHSLAAAGIALAGGSDSPFAGEDPWQAMAAAVSRRTDGGQVILPDEVLTPDSAVELYLADPADLSRRRRVAPGEPADLCLLARPWSEARACLSSTNVRAAFVAGRRVDDGIDEAPG